MTIKVGVGSIVEADPPLLQVVFALSPQGA